MVRFFDVIKRFFMFMRAISSYVIGVIRRLSRVLFQRLFQVFIGGLLLSLSGAVSCDLLDGGFLGGENEKEGVETLEEIKAKCIEINELSLKIGLKDVWLHGYVVGGDLTSKNASFEPPFSAASNLLLGPSTDCRERPSCASVSLPSGSVRNALNLVTNPDILGREIYVKGEVVVSYFGLIGIKPAVDYRLVE